jgi:hypothetical protein
MIGYDIAHGDGLVVIDARGDLIADVLDRIPASRTRDVIVIDPTDGDHLIGINPLIAGPPEQAAGFTYHVLHSIYAANWGPRTADIARACLLTLTATRAHDGQAFTLVDIPELLTQPEFRRSVTSQPLSPQLQRFWRWFTSLSESRQASMCAPLLNKLRTFTLSSALRGMLGQSEGVQFGDVLATKRIVLVALKKGLLGHEVSGLIGSLVISAVWQATLARTNLHRRDRHPFWLVVDEFQDVLRLPLDLADMLSQARGLGLGVTLAHQYMDQLTTPLKAAVVGTTRSHIVFQVGYADARELAPHFIPLTADDLQSLAAYEIALRPCISGVTAPPVTGTTYPLPTPTTNGAALAQASRRRYGLPTAQVDELISARTTGPATRGSRPNRIPSSSDQP